MSLPEAKSHEEGVRNQASTLAALIQLLVRKGVFTEEEMQAEAIRAKMILDILTKQASQSS